MSHSVWGWSFLITRSVSTMGSTSYSLLGFLLMDRFHHLNLRLAWYLEYMYSWPNNCVWGIYSRTDKLKSLKKKKKIQILHSVLLYGYWLNMAVVCCKLILIQYWFGSELENFSIRCIQKNLITILWNFFSWMKQKLAFIIRRKKKM